MQKTTTLGSDTQITKIGFGAMSIGLDFYGGETPSEEEGINLLKRATDLGVTHIDTSDIYGPYRSEIIIGKFLKDYNGPKITIATKCGIKLVDGKMGIDGSYDYIKSACDASLERLGVDVIDLYYLHRQDPTVDIRESMRAMKDLVAEGKVRNVGLSEVSAETLRIAHEVVPIAAVQSEYSLFCLDPEENGLLDTCKELGVTLVAYSPLGRGFLSGNVRSVDDFDEGDYRRTIPRFQGDNFAKNIELVDHVTAIAEKKGCTASQLALAWVILNDNVVSIPGTKREKYVVLNCEADAVDLTEEEITEIRAVLDSITIEGTRYSAASMKLINQ